MKKVKIVIVLILCAGWIYITNVKYQPIDSLGALTTYKTGLLSVPLLKSEIQEFSSNYKPTIYVDDVGIPHIYGDQKNDVAFGLGYMHAQDRYFQMELVTRTVQGRISEIFGQQSVGTDSFWKPYEFEAKSAELLEDYKVNAPEFYDYLLAYSEGVNTYLSSNKGTDPLYKIFGEAPREWKPEYSLLVTWYMSWSLTYFDEHITLNEVLTKLPEKEQEYFYPLQPKGLKTILPSTDHSIQLEQPKLIEEAIVQKPKEKMEDPFGFHENIGSNNWVVNATKTKDGKSILANDPHLYLALPEAFYEAHIVSDNLTAYGFSIPGVPVIVSGHNDVISWGITNGEWDLVDRYKLEVKDENLYLYEGEWVPFDEKKYTINVKGSDAITIKNNSTAHGKVIKGENNTYYAQHWYAANKSYSVKAIYEMMHGQNWNDFTDALKEYAYPPQNFIYNDINDNIGIVCAGKLPNREGIHVGQLLDGTKGVVASTALDTLWHTKNPSNNFLFSANQQPVQNNTYFGYHGLKDDYRVNRINSLLETKNDWGIEEIKSMQSDEVDLSFFEFKELLSLYEIPEEYQELVQRLENWDGDMKSSKNEALVYELLRRTVQDKASNFAQEHLKVSHAPSFKYFVKYLKDKEYTVAGSPSKKEILYEILSTVDETLKQYHGDAWKDETYKNLALINIRSISFLPGLGEKIENVGGNSNTINLNTKYSRPVFRSIYQMDKGSIKGYTILAGGQSGKINSKNYTNQLGLWKDGKYKESQYKSHPNELKNIDNIIKFN
ncbi:penicillin acylase [Dokdonia pacifica]|uniref:Penicillin amidase n=1 Tax=Dokdonia pacifica TaxID=1627892 RepID=A0A239E4Y7_9FLAO|nr:penicillin acylase family protein [Dokdonia pacifica]GGG24273.1 penicillin acylase [Dokdonia pacifica]SNS39012.1 penicillin amidase [Dokdonia pacifica]